MAQRRMVSPKVIDTDDFMDMPMSAQNLYFHMLLRADDDGFLAAPKRIMRLVGAADDDIKVLFAKQYVMRFESGVCVIRHWRVHNLIRADRYHPTIYTEEKTELSVDDNGVYNMATTWQPNGNQRLPEVRLGKDRLGKDKEEGKSASKADSQYKTKDGDTLPVNTTRYTRLKDEYGESTVCDYIERAHRYSLKKKGDASYYRDYSSAAEDYMKRDGVAKQTKTVFEPEVEAFFNSENYRRQAKVGEFDPRRQ